MKAILWDGHKQIKGELILEKKRIKFSLLDFSETDLDFNLAYGEIKSVKYYKLYDNTDNGLRITSDQGTSNVFIVEEPQTIKQSIEIRCRLHKSWVSIFCKSKISELELRAGDTIIIARELWPMYPGSAQIKIQKQYEQWVKKENDKIMHSRNWLDSW